MSNQRPKIHRRLPVMGWVFLVITAAVCVAAIMKSQSPLLFILCGGMVGALLVSWRMARSMVANIELRRDVTDRVWQGQTVHLGYYLRNPKPSRSSLGLTIEEIAPEGIQSAAGYCVFLQAGRAFRAGARFVCYRRGRILLSGARVSSSFPFGFVTAWRIFPNATSITVWPARGTLKQQVLNRGAVETSDAAPSPVSGGQDEFFGLREYRSDDNPRWIHWRKSAARAVPVIREMARPLPETLWVLVDTFCAGNDELELADRERRLSFAATLIDHAYTRGYQVGLALACDTKTVVLTPGGALAKRTALLDALAGVDHNQHTTLQAVINAIPRGTMRKSQLVAVVDDAPAASEVLSSLRGQCGHVTVIDRVLMPTIFDEPALPKPPTQKAHHGHATEAASPSDPPQGDPPSDQQSAEVADAR